MKNLFIFSVVWVLVGVWADVGMAQKFQTGAKPESALTKKLKRMPATNKVRPVSKRGLRMPKVGAAVQGKARAAKRGLKSRAVKRGLKLMPAIRGKAVQSQDRPVRAQVPKRTPLRAKSKAKHVILRTQMIGGKLTVVGARVVDGELSQSEGTVGNHIVAISKGVTALSVAGVDDPFTMRAFVDPDGKSPGYHQVVPNPDAILTVKFPLGNLTRTDIDRLKVEVFKLKVSKIPSRINIRSFNSLKRRRQLQPVLKLEKLRLAPRLRRAFERARIPIRR